MALFTNQQFADKSSRAYDSRSALIYPVLPASTLLSRFETHVLGTLRQVSGLEPAVFDQWCMPLIERYAAFVQVFPSVNNEVLGGLLSDALGRTIHVLRHLGDTPPHLDPALYRVVVISASLFFEISTLVTHYAVVSCTESGEFIDDWHPFNGSLADCGVTHYWFYTVAPHLDIHRKSINLLLARQLMPPELFQLIVRHPALLALWLESFDEESEGGMVLRKILALYRHGTGGRGLAEDHVSVSPHQAEDNPEGRALLDRLRQEIAAGTIKINTPDALVHVVPEGLFVDYRMFFQLAELMQLPVNNRAVYLQVGNLMGIPKKCGEDYVHAQYFSETPETTTKTLIKGQFGFSHRTMREGMLLPDPRVLFNRHQTVPGLSTQVTAAHAQKYRIGLPHVANTQAARVGFLSRLRPKPKPNGGQSA